MASLLRYWDVTTLQDTGLQSDARGNQTSDQTGFFFQLLLGRLKTNCIKCLCTAQPLDESAKRMCQSANRFSRTSLMYPWVWPGCLGCENHPQCYPSNMEGFCDSMEASFLHGRQPWSAPMRIPVVCTKKTCPDIPRDDRMSSYIRRVLARRGLGARWKSWSLISWVP